jgi:hypothetical protein
VPQDYEVVRNLNGGWDVLAEGATRASSHHVTQEAAHAEAWRLVDNNGAGEVRTRGRDWPNHQSDQ